MRFLSYAALTLAILLPMSAAATAGFAEISVLTPGENSIHENNKHQLVLVAKRLEPEREVVVDLKRWRYFPGFVIGESSKGYFIFDESSANLEKVASEAALHLWTKAHEPAISEWLTSKDASLESGFPLFIWYPCQVVAGRFPAPDDVIAAFKNSPDHTAEVCRLIDDRALIQRYRRTTWGHECRKFLASKAESENSANTTTKASAESISAAERKSASPIFAPFCEYLLNLN